MIGDICTILTFQYIVLQEQARGGGADRSTNVSSRKRAFSRRCKEFLPTQQMHLEDSDNIVTVQFAPSVSTPKME